MTAEEKRRIAEKSETSRGRGERAAQKREQRRMEHELRRSKENGPPLGNGGFVVRRSKKNDPPLEERIRQRSE